jgi:hypothetical protein
MTADILSFNRKKAVDFLKETQAEKFILISVGDPVQIIGVGDMSKAEFLGTLEIAKLMVADEV